MSTALVPTPQTTALAPALKAARRYASVSRSAATRRAYAAAGARFSAWCDGRGLEALPASQETVAAYLAELADAGRKVATLELARTAISQAHQLAGHPSPVTEAVRTVIKGVRRANGTAQRQAAAATFDVLARMVEALPAGLKGTRDRALLLLGFAMAARRSELVALELDDLAFTTEGLLVSVRRSKTDQEGRGAEVAVPYHSDPSRCPVRAVRAWLEAAGSKGGPVFRSVSRHGKLGTKALSALAVSHVIKAAAAAIGEDPAVYSGHSLRAGLATTAARAGASDRAIMRQGRWRSRATMDRYQRERDRWRDNAAAAAYGAV